MTDYNSVLLAHKIEEYPDDAHISDPDEAVWHGLELAAERIAEKYQCSSCAYADGCQEGLYCYKDYLHCRELNKRLTTSQSKPPHKYNYYFQGEKKQ